MSRIVQPASKLFISKYIQSMLDDFQVLLPMLRLNMNIFLLNIDVYRCVTKSCLSV